MSNNQKHLIHVPLTNSNALNADLAGVTELTFMQLSDSNKLKPTCRLMITN